MMETTPIANLNTLAHGLLGKADDWLQLIADGGPLNGNGLLVTGSKCLVGSDPHCTLHLPLPGVDPVHCLLLHGHQASAVRSFSTPVLVNGRPVFESLLRDGDRLTIGTQAFRIARRNLVRARTIADSPSAFSAACEFHPTSATPAADNREQRGRSGYRSDERVGRAGGSSAVPPISRKGKKRLSRAESGRKTKVRPERKRRQVETPSGHVPEATERFPSVPTTFPPATQPGPIEMSRLQPVPYRTCNSPAFAALSPAVGSPSIPSAHEVQVMAGSQPAVQQPGCSVLLGEHSVVELSHHMAAIVNGAESAVHMEQTPASSRFATHRIQADAISAGSSRPEASAGLDLAPGSVTSQSLVTRVVVQDMPLQSSSMPNSVTGQDSVLNRTGRDASQRLRSPNSTTVRSAAVLQRSVGSTPALPTPVAGTKELVVGAEDHEQSEADQAASLLESVVLPQGGAVVGAAAEWGKLHFVATTVRDGVGSETSACQHWDAACLAGMDATAMETVLDAEAESQLREITELSQQLEQLSRAVKEQGRLARLRDESLQWKQRQRATQTSTQQRDSSESDMQLESVRQEWPGAITAQVTATTAELQRTIDRLRDQLRTLIDRQTGLESDSASAEHRLVAACQEAAGGELEFSVSPALLPGDWSVNPVTCEDPAAAYPPYAPACLPSDDLSDTSTVFCQPGSASSWVQPLADVHAEPSSAMNSRDVPRSGNSFPVTEHDDRTRAARADLAYHDRPTPAGPDVMHGDHERNLVWSSAEPFDANRASTAAAVPKTLDTDGVCTDGVRQESEPIASQSKTTLTGASESALQIRLPRPESFHDAGDRTDGDRKDQAEASHISIPMTFERTGAGLDPCSPLGEQQENACPNERSETVSSMKASAQPEQERAFAPDADLVVVDAPSNTMSAPAVGVDSVSSAAMETELPRTENLGFESTDVTVFTESKDAIHPAQNVPSQDAASTSKTRQPSDRLSLYERLLGATFEAFGFRSNYMSDPEETQTSLSSAEPGALAPTEQTDLAAEDLIAADLADQQSELASVTSESLPSISNETASDDPARAESQLGLQRSASDDTVEPTSVQSVRPDRVFVSAPSPTASSVTTDSQFHLNSVDGRRSDSLVELPSGQSQPFSQATGVLGNVVSREVASYVVENHRDAIGIEATELQSGAPRPILSPSVTASTPAVSRPAVEPSRVEPMRFASPANPPLVEQANDSWLSTSPVAAMEPNRRRPCLGDAAWSHHEARPAALRPVSLEVDAARAGMRIDSHGDGREEASTRQERSSHGSSGDAKRVDLHGINVPLDSDLIPESGTRTVVSPNQTIGMAEPKLATIEPSVSSEESRATRMQSIWESISPPSSERQQPRRRINETAVQGEQRLSSAPTENHASVGGNSLNSPTPPSAVPPTWINASPTTSASVADGPAEPSGPSGGETTRTQSVVRATEFGSVVSGSQPTGLAEPTSDGDPFLSTSVVAGAPFTSNSQPAFASPPASESSVRFPAEAMQAARALVSAELSSSVTPDHTESVASGRIDVDLESNREATSHRALDALARLSRAGIWKGSLDEGMDRSASESAASGGPSSLFRDKVLRPLVSVENTTGNASSLGSPDGEIAADPASGSQSWTPGSHEEQGWESQGGVERSRTMPLSPASLTASSPLTLPGMTAPVMKTPVMTPTMTEPGPMTVPHDLPATDHTGLETAPLAPTTASDESTAAVMAANAAPMTPVISSPIAPLPAPVVTAAASAPAPVINVSATDEAAGNLELRWPRGEADVVSISTHINLTANRTITEQESSAEDDASIEAYMNQLLARVRGQQSRSRESVSVPAQHAAEPVIEFGVRTLRVHREPLLTEEATSYQPRGESPKVVANLELMRQIANESARSAIAAHARNSWLDAARADLIGTLAGVVGALLSLLYLQTNVLLALLGVTTGIGVAAWLGHRVWLIRKQLFAAPQARRREAGVVPPLDAQTTDENAI